MSKPSEAAVVGAIEQEKVITQLRTNAEADVRREDGKWYPVPASAGIVVVAVSDEGYLGLLVWTGDRFEEAHGPVGECGVWM